MYGDQSGEFVSGYCGLNELSSSKDDFELTKQRSTTKTSWDSGLDQVVKCFSGTILRSNSDFPEVKGKLRTIQGQSR